MLCTWRYGRDLLSQAGTLVKRHTHRVMYFEGKDTHWERDCRKMSVNA